MMSVLATAVRYGLIKTAEELPNRRNRNLLLAGAALAGGAAFGAHRLLRTGKAQQQAAGAIQDATRATNKGISTLRNSTAVVDDVNRLNRQTQEHLDAFAASSQLTRADLDRFDALMRSDSPLKL